jgi:hypothetical protein
MPPRRTRRVFVVSSHSLPVIIGLSRFCEMRSSSIAGRVESLGLSAIVAEAMPPLSWWPLLAPNYLSRRFVQASGGAEMRASGFGRCAVSSFAATECSQAVADRSRQSRCRARRRKSLHHQRRPFVTPSAARRSSCRAASNSPRVPVKTRKPKSLRPATLGGRLRRARNQFTVARARILTPGIGFRATEERPASAGASRYSKGCLFVDAGTGWGDGNCHRVGRLC